MEEKKWKQWKWTQRKRRKGHVKEENKNGIIRKGKDGKKRRNAKKLKRQEIGEK